LDARSWPCLVFLPLLLIGSCASAPPPGPPQPPPQAALPPPAPTIQDRFFTTSDGVRLHYLEAGTGTTIVFVPGWDMPGWIFQPQLEDFSRTNRVIAFDPRGQGDSDIPASGYEPHRRGQDIAELIDGLNAGSAPAGPVILVGWSLGVLDSLAAIADHGDGRVAALVLVDNSVGEAPAPPLPPRKPRTRRRAKALPRDVIMRSFVASMFHTPQTPDYIDRLTEATLRVPPADSAALIAYPVPRSFWYNAVYSTSRPILYLVRPGLAGQAHNLQAHHSDAQSVILPNVGHAMFVDDPNTFDALIRAFLRQHGL
jgi:microsomal epoxide hydrolase